MTRISRTKIIRPGQLAERLGISRVTLWRWERKGIVPPKRQIGPNVVGWLESEIDEWFEETHAPATSSATAASAERGGREIGEALDAIPIRSRR